MAPKIGNNSPCPCKSGKKYKKCCMNQIVIGSVCDVCEEGKIINGECGLCKDVIHYRNMTKELELNVRNVATSKNDRMKYFTKYSRKQFSHFKSVIVPRVAKKMSEKNTQNMLEKKKEKIELCNSLLQFINDGDKKNEMVETLNHCKSKYLELETQISQSINLYHNSEKPQQLFNSCSQCKKILDTKKIMCHLTDEDVVEKYCKKCYNLKFTSENLSSVLL